MINDRSRRPDLDSEPAIDLWAAAAVREYFLPDDLLTAWLEQHEDALPEQQRQAVAAALDLQAVGEPQTEGAGASPLELPMQHRLGVLEKIDLQRAVQAIGAIAPAQRTVAEATLSALLLSHDLPLDTDDREQLVALQKAMPCALALGVAPRFDSAEVAKRLSRASFLRALGGPDLHRFVGRRTLLTRFRGIWDSSVPEPILVEGPGGIGKSTLVARFVAELLESPDPNDQPDAVFHLDFDRPRLQQTRAAGLLAEIARQARQWITTSNFAELEEIVSEIDYSSADSESIEHVGRHSESLRNYLSFAKRLLKAISREEPRILLFMDSFEQVEAYDDVAAHAPTQVTDLLRRAGAHVLSIYASRAFLHPKRLSHSPAIRIASFSVREAQEYLQNEAGKRGFPIEANIVREVYTNVGRSPLALRLAVGLLEQDDVNFNALSWGVKARDSHERVQAELYDRYLLRLRYKPLRKLARPGLLLRRLTPEIIAEVLAGPCELDLSKDPAGLLFMLAQREGQLFMTDPSDPNALRHRQDVRGVMLGSLDCSLDADQARRINESAVAYYENAPADSIGRIEELYHRMRLEQATEMLDARWVPEAGRLLRSSIHEFPSSARAYLRNQIKAASLERDMSVVPKAVFSGVSTENPVSRLSSESAPASEWGELRNLVTKVIQSEGRGQNVMHWLTDRGVDRIDGPLGDIYAQALATDGRFEELFAGADSLLARGSNDAGADVRKRVIALAASIHEGRKALDAAERYWRAAHEAIQVSSDPLDRLSVLVGLARIRRKLWRGLSERQSELRDAAHIVATSLPFLRERRVQARETAAEVGEMVVKHGIGSQNAQKILELIRYVLDIGEAFPSTVDNRERAGEIGRELLDYSAASSRELGSMVLRLTYGKPDAIARIVEVMRTEVDWTLERAAQGAVHVQLNLDADELSGFSSFSA